MGSNLEKTLNSFINNWSGILPFPPTTPSPPPAPPSMYQQPTLSGVHVRSIRDALHIFYAVARHVLPIISRRLDPDERKSIAPGNVYVWEERSANSDAAGLTMERW